MESHLYNCGGCHKPDPDFSGELEDCDECLGSGCGDTEDEDCWMCAGRGNYVRKLHSITEHYWSRSDAYGLYTGLYCDKCYNDPEKYTYRKDRYHDPSYCGERMNPDD